MFVVALVRRQLVVALGRRQCIESNRKYAVRYAVAKALYLNSFKSTKGSRES
jgi:hypothetical protein